MRYVIALLVGLALALPLWGLMSGAMDGGTEPGHCAPAQVSTMQDRGCD